MGKVRVIIVLAMLITAVFITVESVSTQIPLLPVYTPVNGFITLAGNLSGTLQSYENNQLLHIDTQTGNVELVFEEALSISSLVLSYSGDKLALFQPQGGVKIYDLATDSLTTLVPPNEEVIHPQSWSPNNDQLLNITFRFESGISNFVYGLELFNLITNSTTPLFTQAKGEPLIGFPLPPYASLVNFETLQQATWNPVYLDWILMQFEGTNPNLFTPEGFLRIIPVTIAYNIQTGQMISFDTLYSSNITTSPIVWSSDGQSIVLQTDEDVGRLTQLIAFDNPQATASLTPLMAADSQNQVLLDWFGVDNLLLTTSRDSQTNDVVYYISQVISGEWFTREFLRLPATQFEQRGDRDWRLTAGEEEKHALSCLFDQAMPARISLGTRARVNFTDGTALRLRAEPDFDAAELMQMPEGTEFDVIGGPACVNAADYYRFWELQLDDGTTGWAAEADTSDYFIEAPGG